MLYYTYNSFVLVCFKVKKERKMEEARLGMPTPSIINFNWKLLTVHWTRMRQENTLPTGKRSRLGARAERGRRRRWQKVRAGQLSPERKDGWDGRTLDNDIH